MRLSITNHFRTQHNTTQEQTTDRQKGRREFAFHQNIDSNGLEKRKTKAVTKETFGLCLSSSSSSPMALDGILGSSLLLTSKPDARINFFLLLLLLLLLFVSFASHSIKQLVNQLTYLSLFNQKRIIKRKRKSSTMLES